MCSVCGPTAGLPLPQDKEQSERISWLVGTELSPTLQPDGYGSMEYRHTKRDQFLARRTMRR